MGTRGPCSLLYVSFSFYAKQDRRGERERARVRGRDVGIENRSQSINRINRYDAFDAVVRQDQPEDSPRLSPPKEIRGHISLIKNRIARRVPD